MFLSVCSWVEPNPYCQSSQHSVRTNWNLFRVFSQGRSLIFNKSYPSLKMLQDNNQHLSLSVASVQLQHSLESRQLQSPVSHWSLSQRPHPCSFELSPSWARTWETTIGASVSRTRAMATRNIFPRWSERVAGVECFSRSQNPTGDFLSTVRLGHPTFPSKLHM